MQTDAIDIFREVEVWKEAHPDEYVNHYHYEGNKALLEDKSFRGAWIADGKSIVVDMTKARAIHLQRIRESRQKKFIEMGFPYQLDADVERAILPPKTKIKLQELRDLPQTLNLSSANTPEELKAIWPIILKESPQKGASHDT